MIVHTYLREAADFWKSRGIEVKRGPMADGYEMWEMDIPEDHPDRRHPGYIGLQAQEVMEVLPGLVRQRMTLPLYTIKHGKLYADIADSAGKRGTPIARNPVVLEKLLKVCVDEPHKNKIQKLTTKSQLMRVLREAEQQGTESMLYFLRELDCETVPIASVLTLIQEQPKPKATIKNT